MSKTLRQSFAMSSLLTSCSLAWLPLEAGELLITENGQPRATIVVAAQTDDKVKRATEELQHYLEKISGAKLSIATDEKGPSGTLILVGTSKITEAMKVEIPSGVTNERTEEGFTIVCQGDRLVLAGNNDGPIMAPSTRCTSS